MKTVSFMALDGMLQGIYDAIVGLWELVQTLGSLALDVFGELGNIAKSLRDIGDGIIMYLGFFPPAIITVLASSIALLIAYKIAGRS